MPATALLILLGVVATGCDGGTSARLSRAECEQYAARMIDGPAGGGIFAEDTDLRAELITRITGDCLEGNADRTELNCLLATDDDLASLRCISEGAKRTNRKDDPLRALAR